MAKTQRNYIEELKHSEPEQAVVRLRELAAENPGDAVIRYRLACTLDKLGLETEAVGHYEAAISGDLPSTDLQQAFLGLGSTYRALGLYHKSIEVLNEAVELFPGNRALRVFRAMTLYNLGRHTEAVETLLTELADTTSAADIRLYERALRFYAPRLDETWK